MIDLTKHSTWVEVERLQYGPWGVGVAHAAMSPYPRILPSAEDAFLYVLNALDEMWQLRLTEQAQLCTRQEVVVLPRLAPTPSDIERPGTSAIFVKLYGGFAIRCGKTLHVFDSTSSFLNGMIQLFRVHYRYVRE